MIKDLTHLLLRGGDIATVRGHCESDTVDIVPLYLVDESGDRQVAGKTYRKEIDEFYDYAEQKYPESWFGRTAFGKRLQVQMAEVERSLDPFMGLTTALESSQDPFFDRVTMALSRHVDPRDIGVIGSALVGSPGPTADIDIVVRGLQNMRTLRQQFDEVLAELGAVCGIPHIQLKKSQRKYERLFNAENNSFVGMIRNRWSTICIPRSLFCKVRFTLDPEVDPLLRLPTVREGAESTVSGIVVDSEGTAFMPRCFVLESPQCGQLLVATMFWDYGFCVDCGDIVSVTGWCAQECAVVVIRDRRRHGIIIENQESGPCRLLPT